MTDYQNIANELKVAEQNIKNNFIELVTLDYRRAEHFCDYFKHNRQEDLERFRKDTILSKKILHSIKKDFRKIIGGMSLIEKDASKHQSFNTVLKRSKYMGSLLHDFSKHRKIQINASRTLLHNKEIRNLYLKKGYELYKKGICTVQEKRLILSFGKERDLVTMFEGHFKNERERIDAAFQIYSNEKNKNMPMTEAPLSIVVLMPTVGASLALSVHAGYQWANYYSAKYKKLFELA